MILLIDTSTPVCRLTFVDADSRIDKEWEANRELAKGLLAFIQSNLETLHISWNDLTGIVAFRGPGSFTGLRIGLTVVNTIANAQQIPIVGTIGETWQELGLARLEAGEDDGIVLPEYGADAHITTPRK